MQFVSKRKRLRLVLKPTTYVVDAYGQRVPIPGYTVEFVNGRFETDDVNLINTLLKHPLKGSEFVPVEDEDMWYAKHPEFAPKVEPVSTGAIDSVNTVTSQTITEIPSILPIKDRYPKSELANTSNLESIIETKITEKIMPVLEKLEKVISKDAMEEQEEKQKRVYTCAICGEKFRSGFEVGEHRKLIHNEEPKSVEDLVSDVESANL